MQSSSKLCYSISPGSMLAAAAPASRCKAQPKPCDTVLASCWLQSLRTQTIWAEGLIICSNLWGEDELGQHRDKKYKRNSAPLLLMGYSVCVEGSWGGEEGGQGVHIILSAFQMSASTLNKRLSLLSEPRDVTHITAGSSTCVPVCDSAETRHTQKKKKSSTAKRHHNFFPLLIPRKPVCWMDCECAASCPHNSSEQYVADIWLSDLLVWLAVYRTLLETIRITVKHWGQG